MTLQQLRYVIEVAKTGSMNVAAKQLFVSQPSLSMAIRELENDVHISIFERTTKGVVITAEGEEFLGYQSGRTLRGQIHRGRTDKEEVRCICTALLICRKSFCGDGKGL